MTIYRSGFDGVALKVRHDDVGEFEVVCLIVIQSLIDFEDDVAQASCVAQQGLVGGRVEHEAVAVASLALAADDVVNATVLGHLGGVEIHL